jgi:predicted Zn-dependent protease
MADSQKGARGGDRRGGRGRSPQRSGQGGPGASRGRSGGASRRGGSQGGGKNHSTGSRQGSDARQGRQRRDGGAQPKQRRDLKGSAVNLPKWVVDDLTRVTPASRVAGALEALGAASEALAESRHHVAVKHATKAKALAPRDATVRETLGIALYRTGRWNEALSELRTYRRIAGETTHLPVEMDILRALGRSADVGKAWDELERRGGKPAVMKEGRVVYASHLIDEGDVEAAFRLTNPARITGKPFQEDLRVWYVAARAAALLGDVDRASDLRNAILEHDPAFPGIDDLESTIAKQRR